MVRREPEEEHQTFYKIHVSKTPWSLTANAQTLVSDDKRVSSNTESKISPRKEEEKEEEEEEEEADHGEDEVAHSSSTTSYASATDSISAKDDLINLLDFET